MIRLTLPWPPSDNRRLGHGRGRVYRTRRETEFRKEVAARFMVAHTQRGGPVPIAGNDQVILCVRAFPPDKRRRDLTNVLKSLCDALTAAGVWADDSQVVMVHAEMFPTDGNGRVEVEIEER